MATSVDTSGAGRFSHARQTLDAQKLKRLGGLEFRSGIARIGMALVGAQVQLHDLAGLRIEIQCLEIDPEGIGCESRLEKYSLRWWSNTVRQRVDEILG